MRLLVALAVGSAVLCAAASTQAEPPPVDPSEASAMLGTLAGAGVISLADADRLVRTYALPNATERRPGPRTCGTDVFLRLRPWLRANGVRIQPVPPPSVGHVDSATFPIRVFYNTAAKKALAQEALGYAEETWARQIVDRGYRSPFTLGDPDPVIPGLDYYFTTTTSYGGLTVPLADVPSTPQCDCSTRIMLADNQVGSNLAADIEHEFNHATQMATDCAEASSAWEPFAAAVEYLTFPDNWMLVPYAMPEFQKWPERSLDYMGFSPTDSPSFYYQYGMMLFPLFLMDRYGKSDPAYLREVWESFKETGTIVAIPAHGTSTCSAGNDPDWFQGIDTLLGQKGSSLKQAFTEFAEWRAIVGAHDDGVHFVKGGTFPEPVVALSLTHFPRGGNLDVYEYGTRYIEYLPISEGEGPLQVTITARPEASWSGSILLWRSGEPVESIALTFDANAVAVGETPPLAGVQRVLFVVNQLQDASHRPDDRDWYATRFFKYQFSRLAGPDAGAPPGPDAGEPGPDAAEPGPDAASSAQADAGSTERDAGAPADAARGCGCTTSGGALALGGLSLLGLALPRRRERRA